MPPSPLEPIPVLRTHLQELYEAVDTAYGAAAAEDLARGYKNVGGTNRPSNLTKRLEKALDRLQGYLVERDENELPEA
jgi:hypothetical protein